MTTEPAPSEVQRGLCYGVAAYGLWGISPIFWKLLAHVDPLEVLAHRVVWGLLTFAIIVGFAGVTPTLRAALGERRTLIVMGVSGTLLAINWGMFITAVATDHLLDASLGYFINPLVSVALGTLVLREKLRRLQWVAIVSALAGVGLLTWQQLGRIPWIALVLAASFGLYGLVRKTARVDSLVGSTIETALLMPIAMIWLAVLGARGGGQLGHVGGWDHLVLIATGVATAGPLLLFTSAARRLPLATVGFLQYLTPTGHFLLAVFVFHEPFEPAQMLAFGCIWVGLLAFSVDLWRSDSTGKAR